MGLGGHDLGRPVFQERVAVVTLPFPLTQRNIPKTLVGVGLLFLMIVALMVPTPWDDGASAEIEGDQWLEAFGEFCGLGSEQQRQLVSLYKTLIHHPEVIEFNLLVIEGLAQDDPNKYIDTSVLLNMNEDERISQVNSWYHFAGVLADVKQLLEVRQQFKTENPVLVDYSAFLSAIENYVGGTAAFRRHAEKLSTEFSREVSREYEFLVEAGFTYLNVEMSLDAWTATGEAFLALVDGLKSVAIDGVEFQDASSQLSSQMKMPNMNASSRLNSKAFQSWSAT